jgi:hypothetical protein
MPALIFEGAIEALEMSSHDGVTRRFHTPTAADM